ncbi:MAG: tRNA (adenosine(37)-N6)-dimethylallyltransferase MiaA [Tannerella sp.]|jgi:tRNA dimethylallyltransferase|nr:tRNA (adenosine(37)-N6)-dimethylallyltransferase MiaA [Tannerella sp.]
MNTLLVLPGPTCAGKTALSLRLAKKYGAPIISADSRQLYRELAIGTAAPTPEQLAQARHYMVGTLELTESYSASRFEADVMALLGELFERHHAVILAGGSMMYIDAVCRGIDDMPSVAPDVREAVSLLYEREGLTPLLDELRQADPAYWLEVDRRNYRRVIHAVEICRTAARPYSSFRTHRARTRPFHILKTGLTRPREELCARIDRRVDAMMAAGLLDEARRVSRYRHLNALNTLGYKELFRHIDGEWTLAQAVEKIRRNTRVYARKQMTWFRRDSDIEWFHPDDEAAIIGRIDRHLADTRR